MKKGADTQILAILPIMVIFVGLAAVALQMWYPAEGTPDFPNANEGTIIFVKAYSGPDDPVVFFESRVVPVSISYSQSKNRITAGSPPLSALWNLDEPAHIAYSFTKGGTQQLYINGELRQQSAFELKNRLTGLVVRESATRSPTAVTVYGSSLIPPDILQEYKRANIRFRDAP